MWTRWTMWTMALHCERPKVHQVHQVHQVHRPCPQYRLRAKRSAVPHFPSGLTGRRPVHDAENEKFSKNFRFFSEKGLTFRDLLDKIYTATFFGTIDFWGFCDGKSSIVSKCGGRCGRPPLSISAHLSGPVCSNASCAAPCIFGGRSDGRKTKSTKVITGNARQTKRSQSDSGMSGDHERKEDEHLRRKPALQHRP